MKNNLKTPAGRLAETKRLTVAFQQLQFDVWQLVHETNDGFHDDETINKSFSRTSRRLERFAGRMLMTGGMASDDWYDLARKGGK